MKYNQITVVDLKKLEVCRYKVIDIVKKNIEDFPFFQGSLKKLGINLEDFYCNLDRKEFRITILKTLFPDYEVKDCQYGCYEKGHPDYKLCKDSEELFVEWKFNQDALRKSQVEWFIKNKCLDQYNKIINSA